MELGRTPVAGAGHPMNVPGPTPACTSLVPSPRLHGLFHTVLLAFAIVTIFGFLSTEEMHSFPDRAWSPQWVFPWASRPRRS